MRVVAEVGLEAVQFDARGLVPAIVQGADGGDVRMLGYMNREALERTLRTGEESCFHRRLGVERGSVGA